MSWPCTSSSLSPGHIVCMLLVTLWHRNAAHTTAFFSTPSPQQPCSKSPWKYIPPRPVTFAISCKLNVQKHLPICSIAFINSHMFSLRPLQICPSLEPWQKFFMGFSFVACSHTFLLCWMHSWINVLRQSLTVGPYWNSPLPVLSALVCTSDHYVQCS